jgi:predicted anti-sigma-YlaC factor YlaD
MGCDQWQEAIGALLDGEDPGMSPELIDAHVDRCPGCQQFRDLFHDLRRAQVHEAVRQPDLAPTVVKTAKLMDGTRTWSVARGVLAVCALEVLFFSLRELLSAGSNHDIRHLGAFSIAYAAVMFVVVFRPARARTMLPVALMLGAAIGLSAIFDVVAGHVPLVGEMVHIPELIGVVTIWLLSIPSRVKKSESGRNVGAPRLRSVDRLEDSA